MYQRMVVEVLKWQFRMCVTEEKKRLGRAENKKVLLRRNTSFFSTLEDKVCEKLLRASLHRVFWNVDPPELPSSYARIVYIFSDKTAMSFKCSALVAYLTHAALLIFSKEYERGMSNGHSLVAFGLIGTKKSKRVRVPDIMERRESVYWYSTSKVMYAADSIQVTSAADEETRCVFCTNLWTWVTMNLSAVVRPDLLPKRETVWN